jgi:hypothetical protein
MVPFIVEYAPFTYLIAERGTLVNGRRLAGRLVGGRHVATFRPGEGYAFFRNERIPGTLRAR